MGLNGFVGRVFGEVESCDWIFRDFETVGKMFLVLWQNNKLEGETFINNSFLVTRNVCSM